MSKVKTKTALCVQKLIDAGAVVVGKNKMSEFAFAGGYVTEHIDYLLPFNPRGDGYNSPGDSSGGSAAAVASYDWLDASMGSDTGGSIRGPALQNAVHGNRPTQDAVNLTGALPLSSAMDTSGIIARDPVILSKFTRSLYAGTIKEYSGLPSEVLLDSGSEQFLLNLEKDSTKAANAVGEFLNSLTSLLSANGSVFSIDSAWTNSTPKALSDEPLSNIVGNVYLNLTTYEQWNEFGKDYVEEYKSLHGGAFPHMVPEIREGWMNANKTMTQLTHEDDLASKKGVEEWVASEFLTADNKSCSNAVYVYLSASYPSYKPDVSQEYVAPSTQFIANKSVARTRISASFYKLVPSSSLSSPSSTLPLTATQPLGPRKPARNRWRQKSQTPTQEVRPSTPEDSLLWQDYQTTQSRWACLTWANSPTQVSKTSLFLLESTSWRQRAATL